MTTWYFGSETLELAFVPEEAVWGSGCGQLGLDYEKNENLEFPRKVLSINNRILRMKESWALYE